MCQPADFVCFLGFLAEANVFSLIHEENSPQKLLAESFPNSLAWSELHFLFTFTPFPGKENRKPEV
jgi:hypothetical protein